MSPEKEITIYDIATYLNISAATVSRGLKDSKAISKTTRKRIFEAAERLGYQSNTFASSLRSRKTNTIGVIVPRLNSYFIATVLAGMEATATKEGYNLIITQSLEHEAKEISNARTLYNKRVDGLLISLAADTKDYCHLAPFRKKGLPVIFFDRSDDAEDSTSVIIDNRKAAYDLTKHLINMGCRRIMHIGGNIRRNVYADRLAGYKEALQDHHIKVNSRLVHLTDLSEEAGIRAASLILGMKQKPDAVFAANDNCAVHCMLHLKKAGVRIPEDIAFAGFNNDPISRVAEPNLTTVNYPGHVLGITAMQHMVNHINGVADVRSTNSVVLRSELLVRESSLKIKS